MIDAWVGGSEGMGGRKGKREEEMKGGREGGSERGREGEREERKEAGLSEKVVI